MRDVRQVIDTIIGMIPESADEHNVRGTLAIVRDAPNVVLSAPEMPRGWGRLLDLVSVILADREPKPSRGNVLTVPMRFAPEHAWRARILATYMDKTLDFLVAEGLVVIDSPVERKPQAVDVLLNYCAGKGWSLAMSTSPFATPYMGQIRKGDNGMPCPVVEVMRMAGGVEFHPLLCEATGRDMAQRSMLAYEEACMMARELSAIDFTGYEWPEAEEDISKANADDEVPW